MPAEVENISRLTLVGLRENSAAGPPATCHRPRKSATRHLRLQFPRVGIVPRHRRVAAAVGHARAAGRAVIGRILPVKVTIRRLLHRLDASACRELANVDAAPPKSGAEGCPYVTSKQLAGGGVARPLSEPAQHRHRGRRSGAGTQSSSH
jgi:hypothetical protein